MKHLTTCPISRTSQKTKILDLGSTPIVNKLLYSRNESLICPKYPLSISVFDNSNLTSLDYLIDPGTLFQEYTFRSSINIPYLEHCKNMYTYLNKYLSLVQDDLHVDIGGNDGALIESFNSRIKERRTAQIHSINVEPSRNISKISEDKGISTLNFFFTPRLARAISRKAKLITTTNVFQHLEDINSFVEGVELLLDQEGVWCLEFPYWGNSLNTSQFDQIYHEHVYYYLVTPLVALFKKYNLKILAITEQDIHGGSLRLLVAKEESSYSPDDSISYFLEKEKMYTKSFYENWALQVNSHLGKCKDLLESVQGTVVGFGAAAKGCIFLNALNLTNKEIPYVIDDTPEKQGRFIPGTGIEVKPRELLNYLDVEYILILAHNFSDHIIKSLREENHYKGKFIILLPEIKII